MASINSLKSQSAQLSFSMIRKMFEDKGIFETVQDIGFELRDPEDITQQRYIEINGKKFFGLVDPNLKRSVVLLCLLDVVSDEYLNKTFKRNSPVSRVFSGYTFYSYLLENAENIEGESEIDVKAVLKDYVRSVSWNFKALSNSTIRVLIENTATNQEANIKALWELAQKDSKLSNDVYLEDEDLRKVRYHLGHVNEALRDNFTGPIMSNRKFTDLDKLVQVWAIGELADEILKECESLTDLHLLSSSYAIKKYFTDINNKIEATEMKSVNTNKPAAQPAKAKAVVTETETKVEKTIPEVEVKAENVIPEVANVEETVVPEVVVKTTEEVVKTKTTTTTTGTEDDLDLSSIFSEVDINLLFAKEDKQLNDLISKEVTNLENRLKEVASLGDILGTAFASIRTADSLSARVEGLRNLVYLLTTANNNEKLSTKVKESLSQVIIKLNEVITITHAYLMAKNAEDKRGIFRKAIDFVVGIFASIFRFFALIIRKIIDFFFNWNSEDYKKRDPKRDPLVVIEAV